MLIINECKTYIRFHPVHWIPTRIEHCSINNRTWYQVTNSTHLKQSQTSFLKFIKHPYTCLDLPQRQNKHLFSKEDTRILPKTGKSDYMYHCRWALFASCHNINGSDKLQARNHTASYRGQLYPSKTRKQSRTPKHIYFCCWNGKQSFSLSTIHKVKAVYIYSRVRIC